MTREEQQAILTITLMAAFADGTKDERERAEVKRIAESLSDGDINVSALYQDVLLKRRSLDDAVAAIGALELLPQNLASVAIIPLQMKMVYRVGKAHGFELDRGHIKDFLATLGVGLTSQYLEQFGRKLLGGLLGQVAGGIGRGIGRAATGVAFSFATTYALGHVAKRYYAGGRTLSADMLKQAFESMLGEAKAMQSRYLPEIQQKARTLDVSQVLQSIRQ